MKNKTLENLITISGKFKDLKRSGWIKRKVNNPESDAEHSFSLCLLTMLLAPKDLDELKCLKMALIHDLAEIYTGDFTPEDQITAEQKYQKELFAFKQLAQDLGYPELTDLFEELEAQQSREALFVKSLDKIDTVLTACYYDKNHRAPQKLVPEFGAYAQNKLKNASEELKNMLNQIISIEN